MNQGHQVEEDTTDGVLSTPAAPPTTRKLRHRRAPIAPRRYEPESGLWV